MEDVVKLNESLLNKAYKALLESNTVTKTKTLKNFRKGMKFFDGFTDFDLFHQCRIIEKVQKYTH